MAGAKKDNRTTKDKYICCHCGKEYVNTNYYNSNSKFYINTGRIPCCKQCMEKLYQSYLSIYKREGYSQPEKKAVKRLCMAFDIFYREDVFDAALKRVNEQKDDSSISPIGQYMRVIQLTQYNWNNETYDNTLMTEEHRGDINANVPIDISSDFEVDKRTIEFFGAGFTNEDYGFLKREYDDWTARHECNTKAQEEIFKRICFKQLEILKATRRGEDTKNLDATFQNLLDTAKLQPKQNAGDTTADNQTFGTLIDKWENTRPLPEIDEELQDVDKIALYINVFFKGHLAKMMGLKNGLSNLYTKFMQKYTVDKPEYNSDENSDALFDAVFGGDLKDA